jgi:hypothetical protein
MEISRITHLKALVTSILVNSGADFRMGIGEGMPILDGKVFVVVVWELMDFDQVVQLVDLANDRLDAWAIAGIRNCIPARKV